MEVVLVPTTHWDREWYRTFQTFRARLVDAVDTVLHLLAADPGYSFVLDGQTIVCEDYVEIRPGRRDDLERAIGEGRVSIGPWYVQPDSLLPSGEAHVRNLLHGRSAGEAFGDVSRVGYTPDSFGHPAQFPQLFAGFGIGSFVYWRGNGDEIVELPSEYTWEAPDGSAVLACHLWRGYFNASALPADVDVAAGRLAGVVDALDARSRNGKVLLLAGVDHQQPEPRTREVCDALAARTGWVVRRGLLEDFVDGLKPHATFRGELLGGRVANLLPGVWSTRTYLKLRNRACETMLQSWAEPWAALGRHAGLTDERAALATAWRDLLQNQAHDSICGCSQDAVHDQMMARYDASYELARETAKRSLELLAGHGAERSTPFTDDIDIAVFNPSPHPRTDVVRFVIDPIPPYTTDGATTFEIHPLLRALHRGRGFAADGRPARLVESETSDRFRLTPDQRNLEAELVVEDVPAFGWKRVRLQRSDPHDDLVDDGREVAAGDVALAVADDGSLTVTFGDRSHEGLCRLEDVGDRGDTYDFDPVPGDAGHTVVGTRRRRHPSGIEELAVTHRLDVPALDAERASRSGERATVTVEVVARVVPGVRRVDLRALVHNEAADHRLRMLFPTGRPPETATALTTFDVTSRSTARRSDDGWKHPAPTTFPHQGWVEANGLTVVAPGLNEAEVTPDGTIAITLLRAVGWLSRHDLRSRPEPAGPAFPTPKAQCIGTTDARLWLLPGPDARAAEDAERGLWAVAAGASPRIAPGTSLVRLEPRTLVLSALKPADRGDGTVLRVLNPTDDAAEAVVTLGFDVDEARAVRLDEEPVDQPVEVDGRVLRFGVPPHALRTVRLA